VLHYYKIARDKDTRCCDVKVIKMNRTCPPCLPNLGKPANGSVLINYESIALTLESSALGGLGNIVMSESVWIWSGCVLHKIDNGIRGSTAKNCGRLVIANVGDFRKTTKMTTTVG
jgi:hypothetical protein